LSHTPPTQPTTKTTTAQQKRPHPDPHREPKRSHSMPNHARTNDEPDVAVHTTHYKDARVHYPDLKQQPHTRTHTTHTWATQPRPGPLEPKPQTPHPKAGPPDSSEPQQCAPTHQHPRAGHSRPTHRPWQPDQPANQKNWQSRHAGIQTSWTRAGECR
jgi:hypothetical protein